MTVFSSKGKHEPAYDALASSASSSAAPARGRQIIRRWLAPLGAVLLVAIFIGAFAAPKENLKDSFSLGAWLPGGGEGVAEEADAPLNEMNAELAAIGQVEGAEAQVQAGRWGQQLHELASPACEKYFGEAVPYKSAFKTGFVSYPRSGNSYMRSLIERTTGYQTSSVYCDHALEATFKGECNHKLGFFEKTHFPALPGRVNKGQEDYWKRFDQVSHVIRNPLDCTVSWWHLSMSKKVPGAVGLNHEYKVEGQTFGAPEAARMKELAIRWVEHTNYWDLQAPVMKHTMRYEDLKAQPVPNMMSLLSFLLPEEELPSLERIACMVEKDSSHEAYKSARRSNFASWNLWEPSLRKEILQISKVPFCRHGYDRLLREALGDVEELNGLCSHEKA